MSEFRKHGNIIYVTNDGATQTLDRLPTAIYVVSVDQNGNFFLKEEDEGFSLPPKLYGDTAKRAERIINTYLDRDNRSTGVLLSGHKGSGKTLLTKKLSLELAKIDIPTILVNAPYRGDGFNQLISSIDQKAMVMFDEFEKTYTEEEQEQLLTLFDGTVAGNKLFVVTYNQSYRVSEFMLNRPGRFLYNFEYSGLTREFVNEYLTDTLNDFNKQEQFGRVCDLISPLSFDVLQAIVEEVNRYPEESVADVVKILNVRSDNGRTSSRNWTFTRIELKDNTTAVVDYEVGDIYYIENILHSVISLSARRSASPIDSSKKAKTDRNVKTINFTAEHIKMRSNDRIVYENEYGIIEFENSIKAYGVSDIW